MNEALFLVDMGNSRVKWAQTRDGALCEHGAETWRDLGLQGLMDTLWVDVPRPARVLVANVSGELNARRISKWVADHWQLVPQLAQSEAGRAGLVNAYGNPRQMGVDRWMAMLGAWCERRTALLVVDCGTALTVDLVERSGRHLGGQIAPGPEIMAASLALNTAGVAVPALGKADLFGADTAACVASGIRGAVVGMIEGARREAQARVDGPLRCVLSGGHARSLQAHLGQAFEYDPHIVLKGLMVYAGDQ